MFNIFVHRCRICSSGSEVCESQNFCSMFTSSVKMRTCCGVVSDGVDVSELPKMVSDRRNSVPFVRKAAGSPKQSFGILIRNGGAFKAVSVSDRNIPVWRMPCFERRNSCLIGRNFAPVYGFFARKNNSSPYHSTARMRFVFCAGSRESSGKVN